MTEEEAYKVVGRALARVGHHGEEPSPAEVLHHFRSQDFTAAELNELRVKARSGELDTQLANRTPAQIAYSEFFNEVTVGDVKAARDRVRQLAKALIERDVG